MRCGPFDLIDPIGQGSTGVVWRARHREQGVEVAIKILRPGHRRVASAFRNEVRAAARLDHPNIVMLFEQGHLSERDAAGSEGLLTPESPFLAMELCTGGTMADRKTRATWPLLRRHLSDILQALAHAHSRGVIHRDLKPGNALLQGRDALAQVKLSDFGIAHALVSQSTEVDARHERLSGTLQYMAPEQLSGQWRDEGPWTDLYALGVMTYEAVGGRSPWRANNRAEVLAALLKAAPPVRPRMPVPDGLQAWLDRLLSKRPVDRYQSAAAALAHLQQMGEAVVWDSTSPTRSPASSSTVSVFSAPALPTNPPQRSLSLQGVGLGLYGLRPARLAGRAREKKRAWSELVAAVETRRPRVVLLRGPMGVGTSKLAKWLGENAHATLGASTMSATHSPIAGPSDGLPAMLGRYLQCTALPPERQRLRCARIVTDFPLEDDSALDAASLATLIAPSNAADRKLAISAQDHGVRRTLLRLSSVQPLVILIDNAQWAHNALRVAQQLLEAGEANMPLLLLLLVDDEALGTGSAEDKQLAALEVDSRVVTLQLGDISADAHRGLVEDLLGLEPALMEQVCTATSGDALFASALLRHWVRTDALETRSTGFALRSQAQRLPGSLHELWDEQLGTLANELDDTDAASLRSSLEIAAALGESVHDNEWRSACARANIPVSDKLVDALTELGIASTTHLGWRFRHGIMREHLQSQAQAGGRLPAQHRACAAALEVLSRDSDAVQGRIGEHLLEAQAFELSHEPLLRGAIEARERSDWAESHRLFDLLDRALEASGAESVERAIEAQMERVPCYVSQGHIERALELTHNGIAQAVAGKWTDLEALARMAHASIAFAQSDLQEASIQLQRALGLLGDSKPLLKLSAHTRLGSLCMWKRELTDASAHFAAAQAIIADDPAYVSEHGQTLRGMSHVAHCHGDFGTATRLMLEARICFETQGNRFATARCINDLGELRRHQGQLDEAEVYYREALELFESLGAADASTAQCNLGYLLIARTRYAEARELLEELVTSALSRERHIDRMWILCGLWACAGAQGRWQEWDHLQAQVLSLGASGLFDEDLARVTRHAGELARLAGQQSRARCAYSVALQQFEGMQKPGKAAEIRQLLADLG